jgi:hypothetical protein
MVLENLSGLGSTPVGITRSPRVPPKLWSLTFKTADSFPLEVLVAGSVAVVRWWCQGAINGLDKHALPPFLFLGFCLISVLLSLGHQASRFIQEMSLQNINVLYGVTVTEKFTFHKPSFPFPRILKASKLF